VEGDVLALIALLGETGIHVLGVVEHLRAGTANWREGNPYDLET
jgi:hypothetical protein